MKLLSLILMVALGLTLVNGDDHGNATTTTTEEPKDDGDAFQCYTGLGDASIKTDCPGAKNKKCKTETSNLGNFKAFELQPQLCSTS